MALSQHLTENIKDPADSPHKRPVMWNAFPYRVAIKSNNALPLYLTPHNYIVTVISVKYSGPQIKWFDQAP